MPKSSIYCQRPSEVHRGPRPAPWRLCFYHDEDRFLKISLSPSHYEMCYTPYLNTKETTGSPEVSTAEGLEVDDGEVAGIGGSGGELPHCWIQLDHRRCQSLERWGLTIMRLMAVVVMVVMDRWIEKSSKSKKPPALEHAFILLKKAIPWDARYKTHDTELMALFRPSKFKSPLAGRKQKTEWDCQAELSNLLPSTAYNDYCHSFKPKSASSESNPSDLILPLCFRASPGLVRGPLPLNTFRIDYLQTTTDGAVNALSRHQPACREDQVHAAADALPRQPLRKTFAPSRFRVLLSWFQAALSLSPTRFQIADAIASALSTKRFQLFISSTYYCRSSTYQEGAGVQEYNTNATRELRKRTLAIQTFILLLFWILLIIFSFVWARFTP